MSQKIIKAGILIAALVVPALIFLYLKGFGENHYELPYLIPRIDSATGNVMMRKNPNPKWNQPKMDTVFHTVPVWTLTDENDINILNKEVLPLIRGGWSDRNGVYYEDGIDTQKPCSVNINIKGIRKRTYNDYVNKFNINNIK